MKNTDHKSSPRIGVRCIAWLDHLRNGVDNFQLPKDLFLRDLLGIKVTHKFVCAISCGMTLGLFSTIALPSRVEAGSIQQWNESLHQFGSDMDFGNARLIPRDGVAFVHLINRTDERHDKTPVVETASMAVPNVVEKVTDDSARSAAADKTNQKCYPFTSWHALPFFVGAVLAERIAYYVFVEAGVRNDKRAVARYVDYIIQLYM